MNTPKKKPTLLDIAADYQTVFDLIDELDGNITGQEDVVDAFFAEEERALADKVDATVRYIRELEISAEARTAEAERILALAKSSSSRAAWLKSRMLNVLDALDVDKVETPAFRVTTGNVGGKLGMVIPDSIDDVPAEYVVEETVRKVDKKAIRAVLESGGEVAGCRLKTRGRRLNIK